MCHITYNQMHVGWITGHKQWHQTKQTPDFLRLPSAGLMEQNKPNLITKTKKSQTIQKHQRKENSNNSKTSTQRNYLHERKKSEHFFSRATNEQYCCRHHQIKHWQVGNKFLILPFTCLVAGLTSLHIKQLNVYRSHYAHRFTAH